MNNVTQLPEHYYKADDRCVCGGEAVYFEDTNPPGHGCEVEGKPWASSVRRRDPVVRRAES